jgi:hypothetical protein
MKANAKVWGELSSDLTAASKGHANCLLTSNGSYGKSNNQVVLYCSRYKFYPEKKRKKKAEGYYRQHTINCDKSNARKAGGGNNMNKKTSTSRPLKVQNDTTCKVKLKIGIDANSLFLVCGSGEDMHEGHPPLDEGEMPTRRSTVPDEAMIMAKQMATKGARPGLISGVLNGMYGVGLSR